MTCYMVMKGIKQEIDEDLLGEMAEVLHQPIVYDKTLQRGRWRADGTYDDKPLDPNCFPDHYQKKVKAPFKGPDCRRTISSKSNVSKHGNT